MWGGNGGASGQHGDGGANKSREMISSGRVTGKVVVWKGKFGWIMPDLPIQHPQAQKHGGRVFLNQQDVEASIDGEGSVVSFFVYTDGTGLGAARAIPAAGPGIIKDIRKTAAPGKGYGLGLGKVKGKEGKSTDRETLTTEALTGQITTWKGSYGWIKPYEPIDFPGFTGYLFLDKRDAQNGVVMLEGAEVVFHVYQDSTGKLGAEGVCSVDLGAAQIPNLGSLAPEADVVLSPAAGDGSREDAPGLYKIVHFAYVKEAKSRESKDVGRVEMDHVVQVLEIAVMEDEDRIRGRIAEPAGWISLVNTCTGDRWAIPLNAPAHAEDGTASKPTPDGAPSKPTPNLARERITPVPTTGEVVQWKGGHGWLMPSEMLEHPLAAQRGGKVFVGRADLAKGTTELTAGQIVQFHVYADASGLGAEECEEF